MNDDNPINEAHALFVTGKTMQAYGILVNAGYTPDDADRIMDEWDNEEEV